MRRPIRNINIHAGQPPGYLNFERRAFLNSRYVIGHRSGQMPYHNTGFDGQMFCRFCRNILHIVNLTKQTLHLLSCRA